jgi:omega-6 fatty acid desaturase (delta-12 desaturase)
VTIVRRGIFISRAVVCAATAWSLGTLLWTPVGWLAWVLDILVRAYTIFIGAAMAHEASHGHLGKSRAANFWWGRLALLPSTVPYANFRRTHNLHHTHTNDPAQDPDYFARPRRAWEIPFRALAMPHQWFFWLRARGRVRRGHAIEIAFNYLATALVFGALVAVVGPARVVLGVAPALLIVSVLLWYPFAIKTHEGWSTGAPEARSHDYYGHLLYWFSLGLSVHRVHHMRPQLTWLELRNLVPSRPAGAGRRWRDVRAA